jgi:hypothetical protein
MPDRTPVSRAPNTPEGPVSGSVSSEQPIAKRRAEQAKAARRCMKTSPERVEAP